METVVVKAFGKVNLGLDVTGKRADGYHTVRMIMQTVDIFDTVTVSRTDQSHTEEEANILLSCDTLDIPADQTNLAYKAAACMKQLYHLPGALQIHVEKRIPVAAGMAGGSADAAAVIRAVDQLYGLHLSLSDMDRAALTLGADVPFCLRKGTYLAEGIGEVLTKTDDLPHCYMVIVKPPFAVSTPWAYRALDAYLLEHPEKEAEIHPDIDRQLLALKNGDLTETARACGNILETVVTEKHPEIRAIKDQLHAFGAIKALMSGSGPTVFGIFTDKEKADNALLNLGGGEYGKFEVEF